MVDIVTVPFGMKSTGMEVSSMEKEEYVREHTYRSGKSTWKASTIFCPRCSKVREKDTRNGGYKDKWNVNKEDYVFDLQ